MWGNESRHARGYNSKWDKLRLRILARDRDLCQPCLDAGIVTPAREVHHIKAKADGGTDDPDNLVSTCHACHVEADLKNKGHKARRKVGLDGYPVEG